MGDGGGLVAELGAVELLLKGEGGALLSGMGVAGTAAARVEAGGGGARSRDGSGDARGCRRLGSPEEVASTAATRVGVAVLSDGGVRLGDGVGRHLDCLCVCVCVCCVRRSGTLE